MKGAGFSTVPFLMILSLFWARWIFHRSLFDDPLLFSDTLDSPPFLFVLFSPHFWHAGYSTVPICMILSLFWARWILHRSLLDEPLLISGTLDSPPFPF